MPAISDDASGGKQPVGGSRTARHRTVDHVMLVTAALIALCGGLPVPAQAQMSSTVADRAAAATVLLSALITQTENGVSSDYRSCFLGSGSVVSDDARLLLTNSHVVNLRDSADSFAAAEEERLIEESPGRQIHLQVNEITVWVVDRFGSFPDRRYRAMVVANDPTLDLAVLWITGDSPGRSFSAPLSRPSFDIGSSDGAEEVYLFGYPARPPASEEEELCAAVPQTRSVQRFSGQVSGFAGRELEQLLVQTTASSGMSGGSVIDADGRLVGVPAEVETMLAGGVVQVIPIERAAPLLARAAAALTPTPTPSPTETIPTPSPEATATATATTTPTPTATPTPTPAPIDTATPTDTVTPTASPTPTPTPTPRLLTPAPPSSEEEPAILQVLPESPSLPHGACFRVENGSEWPREAVAQNLGGDAAAYERLAAWGWQASAFRTYACDDPPAGEAFWVRIDVHRFADAASAQHAAGYFAEVRADAIQLPARPLPSVGDYALALAGRSPNGQETTIYTTRGPFLIRVTGVSSSGLPPSNMVAVAESVIARAERALPEGSLAPLAEFMPANLPLANAGCFAIAEDEDLDLAELSARFGDATAAAERLQSLGWEATAYRQFRCNDAGPDESTLIDISIHRFAKPASATEALTYFSNARLEATDLAPSFAPVLGDRAAAISGASEDGVEYTIYASSGPYLVRVTGVSPSGTPAQSTIAVLEIILDTLGA